MKKSTMWLLGWLLTAATCCVKCFGGQSGLVRYVDPFVGTSGTGHTHPAASAPFGMVQAGPDTGRKDWKYCSGYQYDDATAIGYSQNRLSGIGCPDLGDVQIVPFVGTGAGRPTPRVLDKKSEVAEPGYYAVTQPEDGVRVEIAASHHAAIYRFALAEDGELRVFVNPNSQIDADWGTFKTLKASVKTDGRRRIFGDLTKTGWIANRPISFSLAFDRDWASCEELPRLLGEVAPTYMVTFPAGRTVHMKVGLSITSSEAAERNLSAEIAGWDLESLRQATTRKWEELLNRTAVEGDEQTRRNWYTALYHLYLQPSDYADVGDAPFFTTLSFWDTFRAAQPWYTIVTPENVSPIVNSLLRLWKENGKLPVMSFGGKDVDCMVGNHAVPVIADACLKGFGGVDWEEAFRAVDNTLSQPHPGKPLEDWDVYDRYGYYPCDLVKAESVSRTLECGYDDRCAERLAKALGKKGRAAFYAKRANYWRNVFDPASGFARGKDSKGRWLEPFDAFQIGHAFLCPNPYTEANAWQYRFHLMQASFPLDVVSAYGGAEKFAAALDATFSTPFPQGFSSTVSDVTGLIGQYAHGDEQSHHVPYLYAYANRGEKTAERIREICRKFYRPTPDGLCGNDDCGQMSAWYLFSSMGFYPVDPCGGNYVIGAPQVAKVSLRLPSQVKVKGQGQERTGNSHSTPTPNAYTSFIIIAKGLSEENKYVASVTLNGRPYESMFLHHADIVAGGELVFYMTNRPPVRAKVTSSPVAAPGPAQAKPLRRHDGIPSFAVSPRNGRMWVTWYAGCRPWEDENNYCILATSADDGKTWKEVLVADPDGPGPRRTFDPELWIAPDGRLRWLWTDRPTATVSEESRTDNRAGWRDPSLDTLWQLELSAEDEPTTPLVPARCVGEGVMMCKPIALRTGEWLYPVAQWRKGRSACAYATRDGKTFELRGGASIPEWWLRDSDEHQIIELKDGQLRAFIRNFGELRESASDDGGRTWSAATPCQSVRNASARLFCTRLTSGNLLLVKHGPVAENVGRTNLTAYVSADDGQTWKGGLLLDDRAGCSYPDGQQDAQGRIHIVYDRNRITDQEILMATFTEADAASGRPVSEDIRLRKIVTKGRRASVAAGERGEASENGKSEEFAF